MYLVYKITRDDGALYIGTTSLSRIKIRMNQHAKHKRFESHNFEYEILFQSTNYDLVQSMEEKFIYEYNTFYDGLNETIDGSGNHLSNKFTTLGFNYSDESKKKMSENHWSKTGKVPWNKGKRGCFTDETIKQMSLKRKGVRPKGLTKLTETDVLKIKYDYINRVNLGELTQSLRNGKSLSVGDVMANGRVLTYENAFCKEYSVHYGVTRQAIYHIIKGNGWSDVN